MSDIKKILSRMEELISVTGVGGTLRVKKDDLIALVEFASVLAEQGESTDAQVLAAAYSIAMDDGHVDVDSAVAESYMSIARAALRAAAEQGGQR